MEISPKLRFFEFRRDLFDYHLPNPGECYTSSNYSATYSLFPPLPSKNDATFEKTVQDILTMTNHVVLNETDIKKKYGDGISNINFLLFAGGTPESLQNFVLADSAGIGPIDISSIPACWKNSNTIYAFQNKLSNTRISNDQVSNFRNSLQQIFKIEKKNCIGIFISKSPITNSALNIFNDVAGSRGMINERLPAEFEETKFLRNSTSLNNIKYYNVYDNNSELLIKKLKKKLYEHELWIYNSDDSCIMLD